MKILAIETSCDDTGIAILDVSETGRFSVLSNIVSSQVEVHQKYGGVYPMLAKREHQKNLPLALEKALKEAKNPKIDLIAVTNGPGLEPCLWVGVNFAKALSYFWDIPIVDVNHIKAHIFVNMLGNKKIQELRKKDFPALCLVVSGGHTQLLLMKDFGKYEIIGETRDDAAGECFDKCAKILGLGYPGGPIISKLAEGIKSKNALPRPMINTKDYDFSFSGLKTAVLYQVKKDSTMDPSVVLTKKYKSQMCVEIQQAIIDVLIKKTLKAAKDFKAKTIILGGGVTANKELRRQFKEKIEKEIVVFFSYEKNTTIASEGKIKLLMPEPKLSTDNALMVAVAGYFRRKKSRKPGSPQFSQLQANANLRVSKEKRERSSRCRAAP